MQTFIEFTCVVPALLLAAAALPQPAWLDLRPDFEDDDAVLGELEEALQHLEDRSEGDLAAEPPRKTLRPEFKLLQALGRNTTFYLGGDSAAYEAAANCSEFDFITGVNQFQLENSGGQLRQSGEALWENDEYTFENYFVTRLLCGDLVRVDAPEDADLCFPVCGDLREYNAQKETRWRYRHMFGRDRLLGGFDMETCGLTFEVPPQRQKMWKGCQHIGLFYEVEQREDDDLRGMWQRCKVMVPYIHGVAHMSPNVAMPYDWQYHRNALLSYVGGMTQGSARGRLLREMKNYSGNAAAGVSATGALESIFEMPFEHPHNQGNFWHAPVMHKLAWEQYASSEFSWQPFGDTATRRGFYDAWMVGSVPVLTYASARHYRRLFKRALWVHLTDFCVLIPDHVLKNGSAVIRWLEGIQVEALHHRRERMREIAPMMQWGWKGEADALMTALGTLKLKG